MEREYTAQYTNLTEIGLTKGSETMGAIATNLTEDSVITYTIDGTYNIAMYPYLQGEFTANKISGIVTFTFNDEETRRFWNGISMIDPESSMYVWSGWEQGQRTEVYGFPTPKYNQFAFMDKIITDLSVRAERALIEDGKTAAEGLATHNTDPLAHPYSNPDMPEVANITEALNYISENKSDDILIPFLPALSVVDGATGKILGDPVESYYRRAGLVAISGNLAVVTGELAILKKKLLTELPVKNQQLWLTELPVQLSTEVFELRASGALSYATNFANLPPTHPVLTAYIRGGGNYIILQANNGVSNHQLGYDNLTDITWIIFTITVPVSAISKE